MTTITRKVRKYLHLFEDMVIITSNDAQVDGHVRQQSEFNIKGFSRMITREREARERLGALLEQQVNMDESIRTIRADFPHLFEDQKASIK
jgi:hypothetical protein